jgi:hypothetical protein
VITYRATLDVPAATLLQFTIWLHQHRQALETRKGMRAANCRTQALMVLRWFRDDTTVRMLAIDAHLPVSGALMSSAQALGGDDPLTVIRAVRQNRRWSGLDPPANPVARGRVA